MGPNLPRLLVFIVAYNAEREIEKVLARVPASLAQSYAVEVLIIDDSSRDATFARADAVRRAGAVPFKLHVLFNPENQGYGGNQKIGFHFAIRHGFDYVALVHGDGQYAPERLPDLVAPLAAGEADAVFGSRMLTPGGARRGGMPLYKFVGNKVLTRIQNRLLGTALSEFHSGYRVYSVAALRRVPFELNSNVFHFDTEIIIQLLFAGCRIVEVPIPTYYGDEISHVNGLRYAWDVLRATAQARAQRLGIFYSRRFDCLPHNGGEARYDAKLGFDSPNARALALIPGGARVLELGCADGALASALRARGCRVVGVDLKPLPPAVRLDGFIRHDLNLGPPPVALAEIDYVVMLDTIEHLASPERFVDDLRDAASGAPGLTLIVSTPNIGFVVTRLMLLLGQFNYGRRGILDMTHTRLFTVATLRRLLDQAGFEIVRVEGVPAPFPAVVKSPFWAGVLMAVNRALIRLRKQLFAYQIVMVARPRPSLDRLLALAVSSGEALRQVPERAAD